MLAGAGKISTVAHMTGRRRWAIALAGSAALLSALGGCSGSDAQGPATSAPTTASLPTEPTASDTSDATTTIPATTTTVPPTSTSTPTPTSPASTTLLPPIELEAVASTSAILALPGVADWVDGVLAVTRDGEMSCDRIEAEAPELNAEVATQVIAISEPTLQEMLLSFDAATAAAVALCQQGSPTEAAADWADAAALAAFIDERIALL